MPWWVWALLIAWVVGALGAAVVLGRSLDNAEVQDQGRQLVANERERDRSGSDLWRPAQGQ